MSPRDAEFNSLTMTTVWSFGSTSCN